MAWEAGPRRREITGRPTSGVLLVDKPTGTTSARAVAAVKRRLPKGTKIGHTGTLDPLATGLLVLMIGRCTRLSRYVGEMEKTYNATARFGAVSDTLDSEGEISELDAPNPDEDEILSAIPQFTGEILQTPPMASAVKVGGKRLYDLHRSGRVVEREARPVVVHELRLESYDSETGRFHICCGGGTYVRSLIADLAEACGSGAYLTALRRESVGDFHVSEAVSVDGLSSSDIAEHLLPMSRVVEKLPPVEVEDEVVDRLVSNGHSLPSFGYYGSIALMNADDLIAVYLDDGETARPEVVLCAR